MIFSRPKNAGRLGDRTTKHWCSGHSKLGASESCQRAEAERIRKFPSRNFLALYMATLNHVLCHRRSRASIVTLLSSTYSLDRTSENHMARLSAKVVTIYTPRCRDSRSGIAGEKKEEKNTRHLNIKSF